MSPAYAGVTTTIDFESLVHGEIITNQFEPFVAISAQMSGTNIAAGFDTGETGTLDPDLEGPPAGLWEGGNLPSDEDLGIALFISENTGATGGILDNPNDEGDRPAGQLVFEFADQVTFFGFDFIDIDSEVAEQSSVEFFSGMNKLGEVDFAEFAAAGEFFSDVEFGDNTANRIVPIQASSLDTEGFDIVIINLGGSGAIDNIVVPTPGALLLCGVAVMAGASRRRR